MAAVSYAGRLLLAVAVPLAAAAGVAGGAAALGTAPFAVALAAFGAGVAVAAVTVSAFTRRWRRVSRALADGVEGFKAGDFSLRLAVPGEDVLGDLVASYNAVGDALAAERGSLRRRELLIAGALEVSPAAMVLVGESGRIVYGNRAARVLLRGGLRLEGHAWTEVVAALPADLRAALERGVDGLATVALADGPETFQIAQRGFDLNSRRQTLVMLRRLTAELRRQEVVGWKTAIRVIGHEVRTHLTAIRSLVRSAHRFSELREPERTAELLDDVDQAGAALQRFIDGYGRFARLPAPVVEEVELRAFLVHLSRVQPFRIADELPRVTLAVDPGQLQQVLLNLIKNAEEAGSPAEAIEVAARGDDRAVTLEVRDRGRGMSDDELARALLPFRSTKPGGTGLGLAICREIVEAHGGSLHLAARTGGGLVVACRLPVAAADNHPAGSGLGRPAAQDV